MACAIMNDLTWSFDEATAIDIAIELDDLAGFVAWTPQFPGLLGFGDTELDAKLSLLQRYRERRLDDKSPTPRLPQKSMSVL